MRPALYGEVCGCTRSFVDCDGAADIFDQALRGYLAGRDEWGRIMVIYYLWHKRRAGEVVTSEAHSRPRL